MANSATLEQALARFGWVTVMEPTFYAASDTTRMTPLFTLDSLRISNFTQEGPTKTAKGGLNAEIVMRHGKTARLEMEDVIGRIEALKYLMGVEYVEGSGNDITEKEVFVGIQGQTTYTTKYNSADDTTITVLVNGEEDLTATIVGSLVTFASLTDGDVVYVEYTREPVDQLNVTEKFNDMLQIEGTTFVINQETGNREFIKLIIYKFLPDSLFNVTMEAEGDFGVMNIGGELFTNDCGIFYTIEQTTNPC